MKPILFQLTLPFSDTPFVVYSITTAMTVSFLVVIFLGCKEAAHKGIPLQKALDVAFLGIIFVILGARIYTIIETPGMYRGDWLRFFRLWEGSMATYGGLIGGFVGCTTYMVIKRIPVWIFLDAIAPYGFLAISITRAGDLLNGTCFGRITDLSWGISFPKMSFAYLDQLAKGLIEVGAERSLPTYPTQILAALNSFAIFLVLYKLKDSHKPHGTVFITGTILYAFLRFFIDFLRADLVRPLWGLSTTQLIGIAVFLIATNVLLFRTLHNLRRPS